MDDEKIFARSFSTLGQKTLAFGAFICFFIIAVNLCTVLKPYLGVPPIYFRVESMEPIICNFSNARSDMYEINGDIRIHGISSTIFIASSQKQNLSSWTIKPYAQKLDTWAMGRVTNFKIITEAADSMPHCSRNLSNIPAIVFSAGGQAENHFHAFAVVLIPLFFTSHQFNRKVIFLVTNHHSPWTSKYGVILRKLSEHEVYDIDKKNEVLCFSRMIVGLKAPQSAFIDPSESTNFPIRGFTKLLRSAYSLNKESVHDLREAGRTTQPRMLIISREKSRKLMNEREMGDMARSLGFDVVVEQMFSNVSLVAKQVNAFDVLVGVHGAGLTNMVFLPENAVLIQITPFGVDVEAMICFEWAAVSMKLRYLEYKVSLNESSLFGKYPLDSEVYRQPGTIRKKQFGLFHTVYLDNQDVNLDLARFRKTLLKALELVGT